METNFRIQKLIWSIVILFAVTLYGNWHYSQSDTIIGFSVYLMVYGPMALLMAVIILILRFSRVGIKRDFFIYIFVASANVWIGMIGIYLRHINPNSVKSLYDLIFIGNMVFAGFILWDVFINKRA